MGYQTVHSSSRAIWILARRQHGVIARWQLIEAGMHPQAIKHRIAKGRLHPIFPGVYAVGRPEVTRDGEWMAAALACGPDAALSDQSAGAVMRMLPDEPGPIHVSVTADRHPRTRGIRIHRRKLVAGVDLGACRDIPVTSPIRTLIDLATRLSEDELEAAVNEADKLDLVDPETLRTSLDERAGQRGVARLRGLLDRHTFRLTDSELERRFLKVARRAGLPPPLTQQLVNGHRVDFHWPELGLVVETDGLRYHRTAAQQAADRRRDQAHAAAGLTPLRFARVQIRYEPEQVEQTLGAVARRLRCP